MPKWVKCVIAVALLPVCFGAAQALYRVLLSGGGQSDLVWVPLAAGALCWWVIYLLLPKPLWLYVAGHELTHAIWTWFFGGRVRRLRINSKGGHVIVTKTNFLITLAPYFFPFYAIGLAAVFAVGHYLWSWRYPSTPFCLLLGAAYGFHVTLTWRALQTRQTDIADQGYLFSGVIIFLGSTLVLLIALPALAAEVNLVTVLGWSLKGTLEAVSFITSRL